MIDPPNVTQPTVIHIAPIEAGGRSEVARQVESWLSSARIPADSYGDVYRALATILREKQLRAVVVCLDNLDAAEMEFFSILARLRNDLRVLVYAGDSAAPQLSEAVRRGAVTLTAPDQLRIFTDDAARGRPERSSSAGPIVGAPVPRAVFEKPPDEPSPEPQPDRVGESADDDSAEQTARVPWLRYKDRPVRTAPPPAAAPVARTEPLETPAQDSYEPLLTQAEIDALMSDDVSSIAPNEPHGWKDERSARGGP